MLSHSATPFSRQTGNFATEIKTKVMKRLITTIAAAATLCACGDPPQQAAVRSVVLAKAEVLDSVRTLRHPGIVREAHAVNLGFKTAGEIERIHAQEGDYVRRGTMLAELDDADYRLGVEALQIQYDQLKDEVERTTRLFEQKSVSANDYEKAVAGLRQLGVQLQANRNKLDYTKLYAPADGYIAAVNFSPAEMVDAGTPLFTLLDVSRMEVEADIPVAEYRQRHRFARYACKAAGSREELPMRLLSLTPKADGNQLYQLRLAFEQPPGERLTAGMNVEVAIAVADTAAAPRVAVPLCAVFRDDERNEPCVWVFAADSTVAKRPVALGGTDSRGRAVIVRGLAGNERVVRAGVHVLQPGERVRVLQEPDTTNVGGLL